jgi:exodeoxyribonuclease VII small subunit
LGNIEDDMKDKDMNFEKALAELEQTVAKLETRGLSLNESLGLFERGVKLARFLRAELEKAEKKVELLLKDDKGEIVGAEPFELNDEPAGESHDAEKSEPAGGGKPSRPRAPRKKPEDDALPF